MPTYTVTAPGFYAGNLYAPDHPRRNTITTPRPIKPLPSWLKLGDAPKPRKAAARTAADDKADVDEATFTEPPALSGPSVEVLG